MSSTSRRTRLGAAVIGAVIALAAVGGGLVACQGTPGGSTEATSTPTTSISPTPSPSPSTPNAKDQAVKDAEFVLREYYDVTAAMLQDPENFHLEDAKNVAISSSLVDVQNAYSMYLNNGMHDIGTVTIDSIEPKTIDLTNKPKAKPPVVPVVEFLVCLDSSDVNTVDDSGKSLNVPGQDPRSLLRIGVANYDYPDGPWLVAYTAPEEGKKC